MHPVEQLQSNKEEADTRMVLYACHTQGKSFLFSPDTDVLVFFVHHKEKISAEEIYILIGTVTVKTDLRQFILVHNIVIVIRTA